MVTKWLNLFRLNEDVREVFFESEAARFVDSPGTSIEMRNKALLSRQVPFVAFTNDQGEVKYLVDRQAFLNEVALWIAQESDEHTRVNLRTRARRRSAPLSTEEG